MTPKRAYCEHCQYPLNTCICDAVIRVNCDCHVSILQDPTETKHAKNTARLAQLLLPNAVVHVGQMPQDFTAVMDHMKRHPKTLLVYPSDSAVSLTDKSVDWSAYRHILVLDGTWRKAKKMWLSNPWLHSLYSCSIAPQQGSAYHIRKRPDEKSLSTLEAIAATLNVIDNVPLEPFTRILNAMQKHWQGHKY